MRSTGIAPRRGALWYFVLRYCVLWYCGCNFWSNSVTAGEITLQDGTILKGKQPVLLDTVGPKVSRPDPDKSPNLAIYMVEEAGAVRFFAPRLRVKDKNLDVNLRPSEVFTLPTEKRGRHRVIDQVAGQIEATPWDGFGHRRVSFNANGKKIDVMQEIYELNPQYVKVTAMDYLWGFGLPTSSIPPQTLDEMLHRAAKKDNPDDRFAIARFYLEGEFYQLAQHELDSIRADFPDQADQVQQLTQQLKQYLAEQAVSLLEERRAAGQHQFAYDTARKFLDLNLPDVQAGTLLLLKNSVRDADEVRSKMEDARQLLGQFQAALPAELAKEVAPLRTAISEGLHPDTLNRLAPFLDLADAEGSKPQDKLALALSGWVLGADQAITDFNQAKRLWQARALLMEYLRAEHPVERNAIIEQLQTVEGLGPRQVARLLPLLPPRYDTPHLTIGEPFTVDVPRRTDAEPVVQYEALLPPEFHQGRNYPMIVVLHAAGMNPQAELKWWYRQAQRSGYILIAPVYLDPKQRSYDYGLDAHRAVTESIRDARRRFTIDSDRIFLGGHGAGADATYDIGYSHPDLFAGIMPIVGLCQKFSLAYRENARTLPQFIIAGELDRDTVEKNAAPFDFMMRKGYPLIYSVFIGRGHENFESEDVRLFDWMSRQKRGKPPLEIEIKTARTTDNQFWWWTFANFPAKFGITAWPEDIKTMPKPIILGDSIKRAKGENANVINIQSVARWHGIWLYPEVVSFEKTLTIRHNTVQLYREIPQPDMSAMLEDYRLRGDRQQIAWGYLELGTLTSGRATTTEANRNQKLGARPR